jgi:D-alanyl-D-alanine carboxypeptidase/D-alanyl-D-alanine-endopeptidase (penicillin-binding protein 4)
VWIVSLILLLVAAIAVAGVVLWPKITGSEAGGTPIATTSPAGQQSSSAGTNAPLPDPSVVVPRGRLKPLVASKKAPTAAGVAAALAKPLANPKLAQFSGTVIDPMTGQTLWSKDATTPQIPASSMKLVTGAALLTTVDPNSRFTTKVVRGDNPGEIVFVGGGDVTLSARPAGTATVYPGAATVSELADQIIAKGVKVNRIVLDTSLWTGPDFAQGWKPEDVRGTPQDSHGAITFMSPLMVDGDREDPSNEDSRRTGTPAQTAGKALALALGLKNVPIVDGIAPPGAKVLAEVQSQPMSILLAQTLENSDNVLAEALARQTALARGTSASFDGVSAALLQAVGDLGIDTIGMVIKDGSGVSDQDLIPPAVLAQIMSQAVSGKKPALRILLTGLPVAGVSGTLVPPRFSQPQNKAGVGWVRAKTGSIDVTYALVGYVPDVDGRILVFAFNSNGVYSDSEKGTRPALDTLAATLRGCGCTG